MKATYGLVVRVAKRLAHQLGGPVLALAVLGLNTGDYEGHSCVVCCSETAALKSSSAAENRVYLRNVDCSNCVRGLWRGGRRGGIYADNVPWGGGDKLLGRKRLAGQDSIDRAQAAVMGRAWWG